MSEPVSLDQMHCPLPKSRYRQIQLGHGSGGTLSAELIASVFASGFGNRDPAALEDQAILCFDGQRAAGNGKPGQRIAFTTDSFVVQPLFFPGGDIGQLAVHGTVNDLAVGGVSSTLNELAAASGVGVHVREAAIPIRPEVHAACEMLGLDPLYVANEGKLIAVVPPEEAEKLLEVMRSTPLGGNAAIIGEVVNDHPGLVVQQSLIGGQRVVSMLAGEQLPRIC